MWVRPGAYHRVEYLKGASLGLAPTLPANIRQGWKGFPETNTLAFYENPLITAVKSAIVQAPVLSPVVYTNYDCYWRL